MSREEAIDLLDNLIGMVDDNHDSDYDTAIKMAIEALEQEPIYYPPCQDCHTKMDEIVRAYDNVKSCEDAVSRQALLDFFKDDDYVVNEISNMPSVLPKREQGEWIEVHPLQEDDGGAYMCSKCRCGHPYIAPHWKYCPNCGAEMR